MNPMNSIYKKAGYTPLDSDEKFNLFCGNCFYDISKLIELSWDKYCPNCDTCDIKILTYDEKIQQIRENKLNELL